jgi:RNase P subunit RPR2
MGALINISFCDCTYASAKCKGCGTKLVQGSKIISSIRTQGRFNSVSNFCLGCATSELQEGMEELLPLVQKIIQIQETLDNLK